MAALSLCIGYFSYALMSLTLLLRFLLHSVRLFASRIRIVLIELFSEFGIVLVVLCFVVFVLCHCIHLPVHQ
jgi:hypothetical protein